MPITIRYQTVKKEWEKVAEEADIPEDVPFVWYDMAQPTLEESELLTSKFGFDHLVMEDIVQTVPRPKFKDYQDYQILVYHAIHEKDYRAKPINVLMKHNLLITYHHESLDYLEDVQQALSSVHPSDMEPVDMALLILDKIIDQYFDYVHEVEDQVFSFEDRHVNDTMDKYLMDDVFQIRSVLIKLKRVMLPMLELIQHLKQEGNFAKTEQQRFYIHHIEDHIIKQMHSVKSAQEMTSDIRDNYTTLNSYRINQVMQLLTLVSVIFLPLTLIAGIYGMNFSNMPELNWHYGYFIVLAMMLLISILLIVYFKFKKWF